MLLNKTPCLQDKIQSYECIFRSCPSNIAILSRKCKRTTTRDTAINVETRRSSYLKISFHKDGYANDFTIELEDPPLAHSAVQFCLRDAQYATLGEARRGMERGDVKLRDYVQTHIFPNSAPLAKSAPPGLPPPVPDTSSAPQSRTPLDQRLTPTG
jgi:hypothetical protein